MKNRLKHSGGYTLLELIMVTIILTIVASILTPKFLFFNQKAHQSKTRSNLGVIRSALAIYYTETNGEWPLAEYPQGDSHYTADSLSLSTILVPRYLSTMPTPRLEDKMATFNGLALNFDSSALAFMSMTPPKDAFIVWGPQEFTPALASPYAYNNQNGLIYIPNGNYSVENMYFFEW